MHACDSSFGTIEQLQKGLGKGIRASKAMAFFDHNLVPIGARRDIDIFGSIRTIY